MKSDKKSQGVEAFAIIVSALEGLDEEECIRTWGAVNTYLKLPANGNFQGSSGGGSEGASKKVFSSADDKAMTAKEFLKVKLPKTDLERIACLAFYMTNYKDTAHFKTADLSVLNTEAAQPKFSNAGVAIENATKAGLLVQAGKGTKQISAIGESYVEALPDRDAAKATLSATKPKRKTKKAPKKK